MHISETVFILLYYYAFCMKAPGKGASSILRIHLCQYWRTLLSTGVAAVENKERHRVGRFTIYLTLWHLYMSCCFILFPSIISASMYKYWKQSRCFLDAPSCPRHGSAGPPLDAGSRFHSELCTALPPPTRAQPRPPTRTTAPQEDAVQKCAKFRQSPRNWHTLLLPGNWCQERRWRLGAEL